MQSFYFYCHFSDSHWLTVSAFGRVFKEEVLIVGQMHECRGASPLQISDAHDLVLEYATLHGKGELRLQIKLSLLISLLVSQVRKLVKNPSVNAGDRRDSGLIPGWERFPGVGNGNPFLYSCLWNPMDRRDWWATVHGVTKSWTQLSAHTHTHTHAVSLQNWGR